MMQKSVSKLRSLRTPRMERLRQVMEEPCLPGSEELWFRCADDVLHNVFPETFANPAEFILQDRGR